LLYVLVSKHPSAFAFLVTVNASAQRLNWHAMVHTMIRQNNCRNWEGFLIGTRFFC
jgi:hypothetical protein